MTPGPSAAVGDHQEDKDEGDEEESQPGPRGKRRREDEFLLFSMVQFNTSILGCCDEGIF